jgi:acylphosphatase
MRSDESLTEHLTIAGIVQGVGYRQWFRREAGRRGVAGWVRNRADETVEAVVSGPRAAVDDLVREAMNGPMGAKVDRIDRRDATEAETKAVRAGEVAILPTA